MVFTVLGVGKLHENPSASHVPSAHFLALPAAAIPRKMHRAR